VCGKYRMYPVSYPEYPDYVNPEIKMHACLRTSRLHAALQVGLPQRVAFKLLTDLNEYMEMRASVDKQMLLMLCEKYDDVGAVEPIIAVQRQVDATTAIMSANVRMMIEAHERLETLEEQAEHLSDSAKKFKKASRQVKQTMRWVDIRMKLLAGDALLRVFRARVHGLLAELCLPLRRALFAAGAIPVAILLAIIIPLVV